MVVMYLSTCLPEVVLLRLVCTSLQRLVWNAGKRSGLQWEPISGSWFSPPVAAREGSIALSLTASMDDLIRWAKWKGECGLS